MTRTIAQRELRNANAKIIDAVASGESFLVTRHGAPVAEIRPARATRSTFVDRAEISALAVANIRMDHRSFRADLDAALDQGL